MLTKLHVQGFKSLRDLSVEFGRFSVLVGANGCGKSSVLQAIMLLQQVATTDEVLAVDRFLSRTGSDLADLMTICGTCNDAKDGARVLEATWSIDQPHLGLTLRGGPFKPSPPLSMSNFKYYRLDFDELCRPSYSNEVEPKVGVHGEHLATVLEAMQGAHAEHFDTVEGAMCGLIPGLQKIRLVRTAMSHTREVLVGSETRPLTEKVIGHQVVFDFEHTHNVPADQASEGTLLLLGLLTIVGGDTGAPRTILLDDLDRALHPKAQKQLVDYLHALLEQRPNLQIIATSHSPYLADHLQYEEVLAMTQSPDGSSLIAPLAKHPDVDRWREEMSAGEFWSSVGDDWIRDRGQP